MNMLGTGEGGLNRGRCANQKKAQLLQGKVRSDFRNGFKTESACGERGRGRVAGCWGDMVRGNFNRLQCNKQ